MSFGLTRSHGAGVLARRPNRAVISQKLNGIAPLQGASDLRTKNPPRWARWGGLSNLAPSALKLRPNGPRHFLVQPIYIPMGALVTYGHLIQDVTP
jgi:hypothetical protein